MECKTMRLEIKTGDDRLQSFADILNMKNEKLKELKDAVNSEVSLRLDYEHKFNKELLSGNLTDNVKEATGESRPTTKMKEAYITEKLSSLYDELEIAKNNTSIIRKDLEYLDNIISAEKYALQLRIKEM